MDVAVSDTSVLNYLARLTRFELLREQFGQIIVPDGVLAELDRRPDLPGAGLVRQSVTDGWMELSAPQGVALIQRLSEDLGLGESQAIALAVEKSASFVLMDEAEGRRRAAALGIPVVGTLGVLLRAKHDGRLSHLEPVLRELVEDLGFRIAASLIAKVLAAAGE